MDDLPEYNRRRMLAMAAAALAISSSARTSTPTRGAAIEWPPARRKAENLGGGQYWSSGNPLFVNLVHGGTVLDSPYVDASTGAIQSLPAGQSVVMILRRSKPARATAFSAMRPGRYHLTWTGADIALPMLEGGAALEATAANLRVIRVPAEAQQNGLDLAINWYNATPQPASCTDFACVHEADLARHAAGETWSPLLLRRLPRDLGLIRPIHLVDPFRGLDESLDRELGSTEALWPASHQLDRAASLVHASQLATHLGIDLWLNVNVAMSDRAMRELAQQIFAAGFNGRLVLELGLECWNYAPPYGMQSRYLARVVGPTIDVVDADGKASDAPHNVDACAYAEKSLRLWQAFEQVFPQDRLVRVLTGQASWHDRNAAMYAYRRPGSRLRAGELMDAHALTAYVSPESPDGNSTREMWAAGAASATDRWWSQQLADDGLSRLARTLSAYREAAASRPFSSNPRYCMYEGSHHVCFYAHTAEQLEFKRDGVQLQFTASLASRLGSGDVLGASGLGTLVRDAPLPGQSAWVHVTGPRTATLHATPEDARSGSNPLDLSDAGAAGSGFNASRNIALRERFERWRFSPAGVEFYARWWQLVQREFDGYLCLFEPTTQTASFDGMWQFTRIGQELQHPPTVLTSWWLSATCEPARPAAGRASRPRAAE